MWFFSRDPSKDFNYEIGDPISGLEDKSVWKIHKGKKKVCFIQSDHWLINSFIIYLFYIMPKKW